MLTAPSVLFSYNPSLFASHFLSRAVVSERTSGCQSWEADICRCNPPDQLPPFLQVWLWWEGDGQEGLEPKALEMEQIYIVFHSS